eukprot:195775-Chlamydomonas_euryale.AAC.2
MTGQHSAPHTFPLPHTPNTLPHPALPCPEQLTDAAQLEHCRGRVRHGAPHTLPHFQTAHLHICSSRMLRCQGPQWSCTTGRTARRTPHSSPLTDPTPPHYVQLADAALPSTAVVVYDWKNGTAQEVGALIKRALGTRTVTSVGIVAPGDKPNAVCEWRGRGVWTVAAGRGGPGGRGGKGGTGGREGGEGQQRNPARWRWREGADGWAVACRYLCGLLWRSRHTQDHLRPNFLPWNRSTFSPDGAVP